MKLSVLIPNRNDSYMLSITVRSILEAFKDIKDDCEIIIVDNSDTDIWEVISTPNMSPLAYKYVREGKVKIIRQEEPSMFIARMTAAREATGEYLFDIDSHMLIGNRTFIDLINFMDNAPEEVGLAYCPIGWCGQPESLARHEIRTDRGMIYDAWGYKHENIKKICWNFGSCLKRRDWWLNVHKGYGFFAKRKLAWGGGEFYVSIKSWLLGYENWAIPTSPIYHIGPFNHYVERVSGYRYRMYVNDGAIRRGVGIVAAFYALAGPEDGYKFALTAEAGLKKHHNITVDECWDEASKLAQKDWEYIQANQKYTLREFWENRIWENTA